MLKPEDCKPGTQVICINDKPKMDQIKKLYDPWIKLGNIYTIREICDRKNGDKLVKGLLLNESKGSLDQNNEEIAYNLSRFKLLNPKALDIFRNCVNNITPKQLENYLKELKELDNENY